MERADKNGTDISVCSRMRDPTDKIRDQDRQNDAPLPHGDIRAGPAYSVIYRVVKEPWVVRGRGSAGTASSGDPPSDTGTSTSRDITDSDSNRKPPRRATQAVVSHGGLVAISGSGIHCALSLSR